MNISNFTTSEELITFLKWYWSEPSNILVESLQDNVWNTVPKRSHIKIEPATKVTEDQVETTPAIIVGRGALSSTVVGLYGGWEKQTFGQDPLLDNSDHRSVDIKGTISVSCMGRSGAEADLLGHEVFFSLIDYAHPLAQEMCVGAFQVNSLSPAEKLSSSDHLWVTRIEIGVSYTHSWELTRAQPPWKTFKLDLFTADD